LLAGERIAPVLPISRAIAVRLRSFAYPRKRLAALIGNTAERSMGAAPGI
jgi:hypothetical protein